MAKKHFSAYIFFINSLQTVDKITAIGTDMKIPTVPRTETHAQIENNSHTGWIPVLFPINFGVIKLESMNGTTRYSPTTRRYWCVEKTSKDVATVVMAPMNGPKNGAIDNRPEIIPQMIYLSTPMHSNPTVYVHASIKQTMSCPRMYPPSFELTGRITAANVGDANLFNNVENDFSILLQSFRM